MYEIRICHLTQFGNYDHSYSPINTEDLILNVENKERLNIAAANRCIIKVYQDDEDISKQYQDQLGTTPQQAIYNQLNIRVWMKGTGPKKWKVTKQKLDQENIHYKFYKVGD